MSFNYKYWFLGGIFGLIIILMFMFVIVSLQKADSLAGLAGKIYRHALTVNNAVLEANTNVIAMHRNMKDVVLARNAEDLELAIAKVDAAEKSVYRHFEIVMDRFLGDKSRIVETRKAFSDWKAIRSEVIELTRLGKYDEAAAITKGKGAKHVVMLTSKMDGLIDFARNQASEFLENSKQKQEQTKTFLSGMLLVLVLISSTIAVLIWAVFMRFERQREISTEALESERERLFKVLESIPASVYLQAPDHSIRWYNREFLEVFGDPKGKPCYKAIEGRDEPCEPCPTFRVFETKEQLSWESSDNKTGRHSIIYDNYFLDSDGSPLVLEMSVDITALKKTEVELRSAKEEAEHANRTKTEFLANMSHELRTPLNLVIGFSEFLLGDTEETIEKDKRREYLEDILDSGHHLLEVINEILDISKIETGELRIAETKVEVGRTIKSCVRMEKKNVARAELTMSTNVADDLPPLLADETKFKQILLNLLSNAIKFTPAGGKVSITAKVNGQGGITLEVSDTGIGIKQENIPKVLEPFEQVENIMTRSHEGSGLGLPLSIRLTELHGGTLDIESEFSKGTTVIVSFPPERTVVS